MSCRRCGGRCQGRYCRPCEREVHRGIRANDDSYPTMSETQTVEIDASFGEEHPHQHELSQCRMTARAAYRELEHAEEPLTLQTLADRLRTRERTLERGLRQLRTRDLVARYQHRDGHHELYVIEGDEPYWLEERDRR